MHSINLQYKKINSNIYINIIAWSCKNIQTCFCFFFALTSVSGESDDGLIV